MSERKDDVERLVELLAEEKTWQGRMFGHEGQARVASEERKFAEKMLEEAKKDNNEDALSYWEKKRKKALVRQSYHTAKASEARRKLEEIRAEIKAILRRRGL